MEYIGISRDSIKASALERLASISVKKVSKEEASLESCVPESLKKLLGRNSRGSVDEDDLSKIPINQDEVLVLLGLTKSTKFCSNSVQADILLNKFETYFREIPNQVFTSSVAFKKFSPTPWTKLTFELTAALVELAMQFPKLSERVSEIFENYVSSIQGDLSITQLFSIVGFLQGLTKGASFVSSKLLLSICSTFSIDYCNKIESIISNASETPSMLMINGFEIFGFEFSSMLFMFLLESLVVQFFRVSLGLKSECSLAGYLLDQEASNLEGQTIESSTEVDNELGDFVIKQNTEYTEYIDQKLASFVTLSKPGRVIGYSIKSLLLQTSTFLLYTAKKDMTPIENIIKHYLVQIAKGNDADNNDALEMINSDLLPSVFAIAAFFSFSDSSIGYKLNEVFPIVLSMPLLNEETVKDLSEAISITLQNLSEDEVVSSIYTLTNLIYESNPQSTIVGTMSRNGSLNGHVNGSAHANDQLSNGDAIHANSIADMESTLQEVHPLFFKNIISSVLFIAKFLNDQTITILVITILNQKVRKVNPELTLLLLEGFNGTVDFLETREFLMIVRTYLETAEAFMNNAAYITRLLDVTSSFSASVAKCANEELFNTYLQRLLTFIISQGDVADGHRSTSDVYNSARVIAVSFKPLAYLLPNINEKPLVLKDKTTIQMFKDAWYNICIHGYAHASKLNDDEYECLRRIAHNSPALASEETWNRTETSIELNTVLRRSTSKAIEKLHRDTLSSVVGSNRLDMKVFDSQISKPKLIFLSAALLLEGLRVTCGDCSTALVYFSDPSIVTSGIETYMAAIAFSICDEYATSIRKGGSISYFSPGMPEQLKQLLMFCCHRDFYLQDTAFQCCSLLISKIPSALCHKVSGFAILDILSILFDSIIDADTNEYDPHTVFTASSSDIELTLSDSYEWRHKTLSQFSDNSTKWITQSLMKCNSDMKEVLQSYVSSFDNSHRVSKGIHYGVSFALDMAGKILPSDKDLYHLKGSAVAKTNTFGSFLSHFSNRNALGHTFLGKSTDFNAAADQYNYGAILVQVRALKNALIKHEKISVEEVTTALLQCGQCIVNGSEHMAEFIELLATIPFVNFKQEFIEAGISVWYSVIREATAFASGLILGEILHSFEITVVEGKGLYDRSIDIKQSDFNMMDYSPTDKASVDRSASAASNSIKPHLLLISFFSSHFEVSRHYSSHVFKMFSKAVLLALHKLPKASTHPFARLARFELVRWGLEVLKVHWSLQTSDMHVLTNAILDGALSWFTQHPRTPYGNNKLKMKADYTLLTVIAKYFNTLTYNGSPVEKKRIILLLFLDHEISILSSWLNPLDPKDTRGQYSNQKVTDSLVTDAFYIDERLAFYLVERYESSSGGKALQVLINSHPYSLINEPKAIKYAMGTKSKSMNIVLWASASPLDAINLFLPPYDSDPLILQYTMRSLESYDSHLSFFYVPQIVQALRHDSLGYVRRYILETANVSQLFAHQIIWNMSANMYKDEESTIPDPIKPVLDDILATMVDEFSSEDRQYYEKEFAFFKKVTGISGKLKPYIKKSKPEKKAKIDEEMASIEVEEGVYLPSNPDGVVIDINRKSGKPLQSHAKAPFMATFKIQKEHVSYDEDGNERKEVETSNLSAIFKVGDDCRQDVLALQLISVFRTIWMDAGLDVFVFPYRVTATAPGCGIIDVLPNSISRDMLGREAVNGLYEYFTNQFGPESSAQFQKARNNFVKSLAAYSIVTYLLQIKDRHNGNIMYDTDGHILHIDFGFCFDIVPGGVKFEQSPFKLTHEMVRVMGHKADAQSFKWFEELCVKSFLACRPYMKTIVNCVVPMLESGLPCFKPKTIKNLEARFVPHKSDKEAANHIRGLIRKSFESLSTKGYDEFQRITNGIPY